MTDSNMKWYLAAGKDGREGKIITNAEALALSPNQRVGHLYTLSAALSEGLITADLSESDDINSLTYWTQSQTQDNATGEVKRGPKKFLTNQLRDKVMAAKIAAAQIDFKKKTT